MNRLFSLVAVVLNERISQRQFYDFYAVYANGLEDHPDLDVDWIVDQAWEGVFNRLVDVIYMRLVQPGTVALAGLKYKDIHYGEGKNAGYDKRTLSLLSPKLRKLATATTTEDKLRAIKWYTDTAEFRDGTITSLDAITDTDGTWAGLAQKILGEAPYHDRSRKLKAASVDRMLSWTHHGGELAEYIAKWLPFALDFRAEANMNDLLAHSSPSVRDALKSASHGVGRRHYSLADEVDARLNRMSNVTRISRNGDHFSITISYPRLNHGADLEAGDSPIIQVPEELEFTVTKDGLVSDGKQYNWIGYSIGIGGVQRPYRRKLDQVLRMIE